MKKKTIKNSVNAVVREIPADVLERCKSDAYANGVITKLSGSASAAIRWALAQRYGNNNSETATIPQP